MAEEKPDEPNLEEVGPGETPETPEAPPVADDPAGTTEGAWTPDFKRGFTTGTQKYADEVKALKARLTEREDALSALAMERTVAPSKPAESPDADLKPDEMDALDRTLRKTRAWREREEENQALKQTLLETVLDAVDTEFARDPEEAAAYEAVKPTVRQIVAKSPRPLGRQQVLGLARSLTYPHLKKALEAARSTSQKAGRAAEIRAGGRSTTPGAAGEKPTEGGLDFERFQEMSPEDREATIAALVQGRITVPPTK